MCIPSYNCESYIRETIESVLRQDYDNIELIISDDSSDDRTREVIESTKSSNPNASITVFYPEKRLGLEGNWNQVLQLAGGTYIKLLPSDDTLEESCIGKQVNAFENQQDGLSLVFCRRTIINKNGNRILDTGPSIERRYAASDIVRKCILSGTNVIGEPGAVLFRREHSDSIGQFNGAMPYVIDLDYWYRLLKCGDAFGLAEPLTTFRIDQNLSVRLGFKRPLNFINVNEI
ncbi:MAG: glycosyltransferase family 2 protein [Pseudomonadota bacterium]